MLAKEMHLDSMYKRHWEEYHLSDGRIEDSRVKNWRNVEWEKVVRVVFHLRGYRYEIDCKNKPTFVGFMRFRCGGSEPTYKLGKFTGRKKIHTWVLGWTDGDKCFLKEVDFYTGLEIRTYVQPLAQLKGHIHPRLSLREKL